MKFVVGLGNPGREYTDTRHNVGWWVLDELADDMHLKAEREKWRGLAARKGEVTLFKPMTFMNDSGRAVAAMAEETGAPLHDILVVLDDLNLKLGTIRTRAGGSAGGHRGLQSVIDRLGTDEFPRLRLGIGPFAGVDSRPFVLSPFSDSELPIVERMVARSLEAVWCWLREGVSAAMSRYNGAVPAGDAEQDEDGSDEGTCRT